MKRARGPAYLTAAVPAAVAFAAVVLSGVLAGCASTKGDAAACRTFEQAVRAGQSAQREDIVSGRTSLAEGARQAGLKADNRRLQRHLTNLATGFDYGDPTLDDLDFTINFMQVGEMCGVVGVSIGSYEETADYLATQDLTLGDLVEFRDVIKGAEGRQRGAPDLNEAFETMRDEAHNEAEADVGLLALYEECVEGDMGSCDTLRVQAPMGSRLEEFGSMCGGRRTSAETFTDHSGWCWDLKGVGGAAP